MRLSFAGGLWLLAALLGAGLVAEQVLPGDPLPPPVRPPPLPAEAASVGASPPVAVWAAAALARPLFNPGRRPDAVEAAARAPEQQADLPRLAGIEVTPQGRYAIFAGRGPAGTATIASEGAKIGVWLIEAIRPAEVQVAGPDGRRTLRPSYSDAPPAPQAAAPPRPFLGIGPPGAVDLLNNPPARPAIRAPQ